MTEVEGWIRSEVGVIACISRVVKMKVHLPFSREFSIHCIEDSVIVLLLTVLANFESVMLLLSKEKRPLKSQFLMGSAFDP